MSIKLYLVPKIIFFELLPDAVLLVLTVDQFRYYFNIFCSGLKIYSQSRGKKEFSSLPDSIKGWNKEFIWLNACTFTFQNTVHVLDSIIDDKPNRTPNLVEAISKISFVFVSIKKFFKHVFGLG